MMLSDYERDDGVGDTPNLSCIFWQISFYKEYIGRLMLLTCMSFRKSLPRGMHSYLRLTQRIEM